MKCCGTPSRQMCRQAVRRRVTVSANSILAILLGVIASGTIPSARAQSAIDDVHIQPRAERPIEDKMLVGGPKLDSGSKPLKVLVDLVLVPVTILDGMNRLVRGLGRDNFQVFFQAEDGIRDLTVTGVQTCALPI